MTATLCKHEVDGEGCVRPAFARGWCKGHWARWKKHGDPGSVKFRAQREPGPCAVDGCARRRRHRDWCGPHYVRWQRHGSPTCGGEPRAMAPTRRLTDQEMAALSDFSMSAVEAADMVGISAGAAQEVRRELRAGTFRTSDWLDFEIDFIVENMGRMHTSAIATFLVRDFIKVKSEIHRLRNNGVVPKRSLKSLNPSTVATRTLIAKTCKECGLLLGGEWFRLRRDGYSPECRRCCGRISASSRERRKDAARANESAYTAKLQAFTLDRAENHRKEWTDADITVLADVSKTVLEKAVELKRTYLATQSALCNHGFTSKKPDFAAMEKAAWRIFWNIADMAVAS